MQALWSAILRFMRDRLFEAAGLALVAAGVAMTLALSTYNPLDPSFNNATADTPWNLLGRPGSYFADMVMQSVGLGALALVPPIAAAGWWLMAKTGPGNYLIRGACWLASGLFASALAASLPIMAPAPLETGLGGVSGDWFNGILGSIGGFIGLAEGGPQRLFSGTLAALGTLVTFGYAIGMRYAEYRFRAEIEDLPSPQAARAAAQQPGLAAGLWQRVRGILPMAPMRRAEEALRASLPGTARRRSGPKAAAALRGGQTRAQRERESAIDADVEDLEPFPAPTDRADDQDGEVPAVLIEDSDANWDDANWDQGAWLEEEDVGAKDARPVDEDNRLAAEDPAEETWEPAPEDADLQADQPGDAFEAPMEPGEEPQETSTPEPARFGVTRLLSMNAIRSLSERPRPNIRFIDEKAETPEGVAAWDEDGLEMADPSEELPMPGAVPPAPVARQTGRDDTADRAERGAPEDPPFPAAEPQARFGDNRPERASTPTRRAPTGKALVPQDQGHTSVLDLAPSAYRLPPLDLLQEPKHPSREDCTSDDVLDDQARKLEMVLQDFGIQGEIIDIHPGPVVTLYELEPAPGIKSARVIGLADDIARSMSAVSARVAVIPGRNAIGIELPNKTRDTVYLRELLEADAYEHSRGRLTLALGKNIGGGPVMADLAAMPHLLIAGTTGSGKSVAINTMILSILYRMSPNQCRLILIDPKMLELSAYEGIPHLLTPVVTDPKKAIVALKWVVREMEDRYRRMSKLGVRNIMGHNERVRDAALAGETITRQVQTGFDRETGAPIYEEEALPLDPLPYIVVVVDEMADLMMVAGKEIEVAVQRLAQMARAAGIHLITATQRPSVDVITGTIKANFPTRISFQVSSKVDSRTILGEQGAEQLLGQGDMLYMPGGGRLRRVHGPFVTVEEVEDVVENLKRQGAPTYVDAILEDPEEANTDDLVDGHQDGSDDLYDRAIAIVARDRKASTSYLQRKLQIGYNRAARLVERMEEEGVVSRANHVGKREILLPDHGPDHYED